MVKVPDSIRKWWDRMIAVALTRYSPWIVYSVLALLAFAFIALVTPLDDLIAYRAAPYLWNGLKLLSQQPIGLFGLLFVVVLIGLMLVAFVEISPLVAFIQGWGARRRTKTEAATEAPTEAEPVISLSAEEKELIVPIRALWTGDGESATSSLLSVLDKAIAASDGPYWADLLTPLRDDFDAACKYLDKSLTPNNRVRVDAIREAFNKMYEKYCGVSRWIATMIDNDDLDTGVKPHGSRVARWQQANMAFQKAVKFNDSREGQKETLSFGVAPLFDCPETLRTLLTTTELPIRPLVQRVKECTADERAFLVEFAVGALTYSDTLLMPRPVYEAGKALARDGVLHMNGSGNAITFTLNKQMRRCVETHVLDGGTMKPEIIVDLRHVEGTGSSGGGATRSRR